MTANIIDGRSVANNLLGSIQTKLKHLNLKYKIVPGLAILLVGNDPASEIYVRNKIRVAQKIGINSFEYRFSEETTTRNIIAKIDNLNNDPKVHGIIIQLPLPNSLDKGLIINSVDPSKDVDGFHDVNVGKLVKGLDGLVAATAVGCLKLIKTIKHDLTGLKAVIVGRSNIVGKPAANLLVNENCTVTIVHSKTKNIAQEIKQADIVIVAVGIPHLIKKEYIKEGAIVIDVGINRDENNKLTGDVDFDNVKEIASYITPVPGGVGPMTIACLLENTVKAACDVKNIDYENL